MRADIDLSLSLQVGTLEDDLKFKKSKVWSKAEERQFPPNLPGIYVAYMAYKKEELNIDGLDPSKKVETLKAIKAGCIQDIVQNLIPIYRSARGASRGTALQEIIEAAEKLKAVSEKLQEATIFRIGKSDVAGYADKFLTEVERIQQAAAPAPTGSVAAAPEPAVKGPRTSDASAQSKVAASATTAAASEPALGTQYGGPPTKKGEELPSPPKDKKPPPPPNKPTKVDADPTASEGSNHDGQQEGSRMDSSNYADLAKQAVKELIITHAKSYFKPANRNIIVFGIKRFEERQVDMDDIIQFISDNMPQDAQVVLNKAQRDLLEEASEISGPEDLDKFVSVAEIAICKLIDEMEKPEPIEGFENSAAALFSSGMFAADRASGSAGLAGAADAAAADAADADADAADDADAEIGFQTRSGY